MVRQLQRDDFAGLVGSRFSVVGMGTPGGTGHPFGPVSIELTGVRDRSNSMIDAFSLLFRGPRAQEFGQCNYRLSHETIGEFELFLVPILDPAPRDDRICYQSIISRLKAVP